MTQQELRRLARIGAEARLGDLQRQMAAIFEAFPDLRPGTAGIPARPAAGAGDVTAPAVKRRRVNLSREARERIAQAQRKRWAEWKANQAKAAGGDGASAAKPVTAGGSRKKK